METHRTPSPGAPSTDADAFSFTSFGGDSPGPYPALPEEGPGSDPEEDEDDAPPAPTRVGWIEGHLPEIVDRLDPKHPETSFTETRAFRHDGWTPEKKRLFLERFAECGVIVEACEAVKMSARSAYNLRARDPLFDAGWDAATVKARDPLADEALSRARNGVVERIYKDGMIVAERHRYDNRLTMAVLTRLDARIDRAEAKGAAHLNLVARWDDYLDAVSEDRADEAEALLAPPAPEPQPAAAAASGENARDCELRELREGEEPENEDDEDEDPHMLWESEGCWWTDYPPPEDFDGLEYGEYGERNYKRTLSSAEEAVADGDAKADIADARARAEAQRDAWFGFSGDELEEGEDEPAQSGRAPEAGSDAPS